MSNDADWLVIYSLKVLGNNDKLSIIDYLKSLIAGRETCVSLPGSDSQ